jgi:putative colanic acid biosynthesis glycosyltransferase
MNVEYDPTLSIITIYKDNLRDLLSTAASIVDGEQEWIIVHGGFENHSKILEEQGYKGFLYLHGSDSGIYDAMNRGLAVAKGRFVWFLNAGDLSLVQDFQKFLVDIRNMDETKSIIFRQFNLDTGQLAKISRFPILSIKWGIKPVPHQAVVFSRRNLEKIGDYRLDLNVWGDQELILRALRSSGYERRAKLICAFQGGGVGSRQEESFELRMKNLNDAIPVRFIAGLRTLKSRIKSQ